MPVRLAIVVAVAAYLAADYARLAARCVGMLQPVAVRHSLDLVAVLEDCDLALLLLTNDPLPWSLLGALGHWLIRGLGYWRSNVVRRRTLCRRRLWSRLRLLPRGSCYLLQCN